MVQPLALRVVAGQRLLRVPVGARRLAERRLLLVPVDARLVAQPRWARAEDVRPVVVAVAAAACS